MGYYSLLWRFNLVISCPEHNCMLLNCCGNCGNAIPFLSKIPRIGICPKCKFNFGQSISAKASKFVQNVDESQAQQLKFLLSPQPFEENAHEVLEGIGVRLGQLRLETGRDRRKMAETIGVSFSMLSNLERGNSIKQSATFDAYNKYVDHLSLTFSELYHQATSSPSRRRTRSVIKDKGKLSKEIQETIRYLEDNQQKVTLEAIATRVGISQVSLRKHSAAWSAITEFRTERYNDLKSRLLATVENLSNEGTSVTMRNVGENLGVSSGMLEHNAEFAAIIRDARARQINSRS
jgi:transcriptional regulator with XRE-family HTH domain